MTGQSKRLHCHITSLRELDTDAASTRQWTQKAFWAVPNTVWTYCMLASHALHFV